MSMFPRALAGLLALKAVDVAVRAPGGWSAVAALFAVAALLMWVGRLELASAVTLTAVVGTAAAGVWNQHLWLIGWVALGMVLLDGEPLRWFLRCQLSVVYAFAAAAKVTSWWLDGSVLAATVGSRVALPSSVWAAVAVAAVAAEAWLAVGLWMPRTRNLTVAVGAAFHAVTWAAMATDLFHLVRLGVFGGLLVALYLPFYANPHLSSR